MRRLLNPSFSMPIAFVVVTLTFLLATGVSQFWAFSIEGPARDIATNAAPSIRHLAAALAQLRHIQALLSGACLDPSAPTLRARLVEVEQRKQDLDDQIHAYLNLPSTFPGEAAVWLDAKRDLTAIDEAIERMTGALAGGDRGAAARTLTTELDPVADRAADALRRAIDLNAAAAVERAARIEEVRERAADVVILLDGFAVVVTVVAALVVGRAISHYQNLQERNAELLRKQVDELEAFAGRVAHDILGPLGGISLGLQAVGRTVAPRSEPLLARARSCVWSIEVIVRDLLAFAVSGARSATSAPLEVAPAVLQVLQDHQSEARAEQIDLRHELDPVPAVACAPGVLVSLLSNLVRNALKHMGAAPVRVVTVRTRDHAGRVRIEVTDSGPGIAPDVVDTLFMPYARGHASDRPGLGLGLATVRRLAEAHGGTAGVDTELGRGSTFWFELPPAEKGAQQLEPAAC